ncbi:Uncharacterised protein family (UPF0175) [Halogranum rubrum]|uniref:Uncharacterized protein family (UPF0175) n=1 Tax=Halogranum rubrum TaxID=553466 RepID=A0A1I4GHY1_9EURY|nr:UPF0175 family protein [Halogranum rubrum]SFL29110.1 Uncharacterised protein family (UPF0175) [Halogranum rubrum]
MHSHALTQALTLYRSETLTLSQAASRAGRTEEEFAAVLHQYGIEQRPETPTVGAQTERPAPRAD